MYEQAVSMLREAGVEQGDEEVIWIRVYVAYKKN